MSKQHFTNGHALIIGVGADLAGTINDAEGFANILTDEGRCAYPPEQVHLLTGAQAHRQAVLDALDDQAQATDKDSTMILYFSGHGYRHENDYYLMTYGYQLDDLNGTTISGAEFANKIAAIPAKQKVILLDCCHAGGVGHIKGLSLTKSPLPLPSEAMDLFSQGAGYILIASSTEEEYSFTGNPYSIFTSVLIEALCGTGVAKKDGYVRVADLALHTREQVPKLTQDRQHPILHFEQADNFIIAYYAAGDTQPKTSPVSTQNASYQHNPYNFWAPVIPPQFVGRVKELRQLEMALEENRSSSLVGDWRIGKTSLLNTWAQQAQQKGRVVVMLSGEDSAAQSIQTFVEAITGLPASNEADHAADVLVRWAQQQAKPGLPPLLLVDEIDSCLKRFEPRFFERLRGMLGTIILVVASHQELDRSFKDLGRTSPFENRLGIIRLGLLETDAAETLIQWGNGILDSNALDTLRTYAGRHPFYLQLFGYHLVNAQRMGESLDTAIDAFYQDATSRLRKLWDTLDEREQQALRDSLQRKPVKRRSLRLRGLVTADGQLFGEILREWLEQEQ